MGEEKASELRVGFNASVRVVGCRSHLSSDGGAVLLRDLDDQLAVTQSVASRLDERRDGAHYSAAELLRLRVYLLALGYTGQSDADVLREDPALRLSISDARSVGPLERPLPSQPTMSRFMSRLAMEDGLELLRAGLLDSAVSAMRSGREQLSARVLDIDSLPWESYGDQGGSAHNGHYRKRCFHPLVVMDASGHLLAAKLRPGNEGTNKGAIDFLDDVIEGLDKRGVRVSRVRGDAGFPKEESLVALERKGIGFAFRLKSDKSLERLAQPYLVRPPGRRPKEPREWTHVLQHQALKWSRPRRIVLVVQERPDSLYLHHFFLVVSDDTQTGRQLVNFYRQRGTMESRLGEWVNVVDAALSSSHRDGSKAAKDDDRPFRVNSATLLMSALAYNLLHTLRQIAARAKLAAIGDALGLGRAQRLLLRVAARVVVSARRATLMIPDAVATMWSSVLARIRKRAMHTAPA
jgi:hypothetical protein